MNPSSTANDIVKSGLQTVQTPADFIVIIAILMVAGLCVTFLYILIKMTIAQEKRAEAQEKRNDLLQDHLITSLAVFDQGIKTIIESHAKHIWETEKQRDAIEKTLQQTNNVLSLVSRIAMKNGIFGESGG